MTDFDDRLRSLEDAVSRASSPLASSDRAHVVRAIRRRRTQRKAAKAVALTLAVAAIGGGTWFALDAFRDTPAIAPSPSASPSAGESGEESPSPTASAQPTTAPTDPLSLVSDQVAQELTSPSTGETWHARVLLDVAPEVFDPSHDYFLPYALYSVGEREGATVAVAVTTDPQPYSLGYPVLGMFEIGTDGTTSFIACPSTRATDACVDVGADRLAPGVVYDTSTHYGSLTYPESVVSPQQGEVRTAWLRSAEWGDPGASTAFGDYAGANGTEVRTIGTLGASSLVAIPVTPVVPGVSAFTYALTTPYGSVISFPFSPPPLVAFDAVTWSDGAVPADLNGSGATTLQGPSLACERADVVTVPADSAGAWTTAGHSADGRAVRLPASDNALAAQIFAALQATSAEGEYRFGSLDEFLSSRSLMAIESGSGELILAINQDAAAFVWDCE